MLGKVLGSFVAGVFVAVLIFQVSSASAHGKKNPLTSPVTSPITSPNCKPGWGFGDKNHCHSGPRGLFEKDNDHHTVTVNSHHDNDDHGKKNDHDDDHHGNGHH